MHTLLKITLVAGLACTMPVAASAQQALLVTIGHKTAEVIEFCADGVCLAARETTTYEAGWCATERMARYALEQGGPEDALNDAVMGPTLMEDLIRTLGPTGSSAYVSIYRCPVEDSDKVEGEEDEDDDAPTYAMVCAWATRGARPVCSSADLF